MTASSTSFDRASLLRRVAKLLALAEDGRGNVAEMESAGRMAKNIMAKHGLTRADLLPPAPGCPDPEQVRKNAFAAAAQAFAQQCYAADQFRAARDRARAQAERAQAFSDAEASFSANAARATAERTRRSTAQASTFAEREAARAASAAKAGAARAEERTTRSRPATETTKGRYTVNVSHPAFLHDKCFSSLNVAFTALGLPVAKHARFRDQLKKAGGRLAFGEYMFTIV